MLASGKGWFMEPDGPLVLQTRFEKMNGLHLKAVDPHNEFIKLLTRPENAVQCGPETSTRMIMKTKDYQCHGIM